MTFKFDQSKEDIINYYLFISWYDPDKKNLRIGTYIYLPLFLLLYILVFYNDIPFFNINTFILLGIGVLLSPLTVQLFKWIRMYKVKRHLIKGKNMNLIGTQELTFNNDGILKTSEFAKSEVKYNSLEKIREDSLYIYIFVGGESAFLLPKRVFFNEEEQNQVLDLIKKKTGLKLI